MSPIPGYKVIPEGWAERHRPTVESAMQSAAIIHRISDGPAPYPEPEGWSGGPQIWAGAVRVQELKREGSPVPAEQPTALREYLVQVPVGVPELRAGEQGDVVTVIGRKLRITNIMFGTYEFSRDLICVDNLTQQNP